MKHVVPPFDITADLGREETGRLLNWIVGNHLGALVRNDTGMEIGPTAAAFDADAAQMEGFSRLLWGIVPAVAGGFQVAGLDRILNGIANGTDPESPAYWRQPGDMDQRLVEMAAFAFLIRETPALVNDALSQQAQDNLCRFLATIQTVHINPSNWRFFRVLVIDALASLGWPVDQDCLARELDFIDRQYVGDGWYQDGEYAQRFDYYNPLAFHFYGLLYARWHADDDPERARRFVARAQEFALSYRHWFAEDGAAIAYGRSLTYRFASAGFWGLLAGFGHPELSPGVLRGLWSRAMRWWFGQPLWDGEGRFTVGYSYPNLLMSEFYNSAQSPLWALKAFAPLLLPADHPFWTEPAQADAPPAIRNVAATKQINWHAGGVAYLMAPPPRHREVRRSADKYAKFAYSSHHGFCVEALEWLPSGFAGDNILALSRDGQDWRFRDEAEDAALENGELKTVWSPFAGCRVTTLQKPDGDGELRTSIIETDTPLQLVATGHAADLWVAPRSLQQVVEDEEPAGDAPAAVGSMLFSDLRDLDGRMARRVLPSAPNTNLIYPRCAVPALIGSVPVGRTELRTRLTAGRRSPAVI
ncbi:DUF2264 domain-containing protein [uncultured Martelella sp.]|uniref:DUF2264 domain-containing protein n=1 Tax=uncultured Martelella sp. TaxID=392331 RepID=UPI0029C771ED|nr:DUF2264 domain-containing protein [uncultured Martelella sp.]